MINTVLGTELGPNKEESVSFRQRLMTEYERLLSVELRCVRHATGTRPEKLGSLSAS